jgi:hypothetical protein
MRLAFIHELPLEYYPPATNLIEYTSSFSDIDLSVYSTHNQRGRPEYTNSKVSLWRSQSPSFTGNLRILHRWRWHFEVARNLAMGLLDAVLYIEPHSALAPYLYYKWFGGKAKLFIHHHEYYSQGDYCQPSNKTIRFFHRLENKYLFPKANWISQTNSKRLELFSSDHPTIPQDKLRILQNLPPSNWSKVINEAWNGTRLQRPLKLVYVGSVSLVDTHIKAVIDWVKKKPEQDITLDIYAYQVDAETNKFLKESAGTNIRFHSQGIAYSEIPYMLKDYHVGLILYKGNTINFQYNATNKLFEYLVCGLDVWYADGLMGVDPYKTSSTYPQVLPVRFNELLTTAHSPNVSRSHLSHQPWQATCEAEVGKLLDTIRKSSICGTITSAVPSRKA